MFLPKIFPRNNPIEFIEIHKKCFHSSEPKRVTNVSRFPYKVVLVRHGQSEFNAEKRITGWYDCNLTDKGRQQALNAAKILKEHNFQFDVAYTSMLTRAITTLRIILNHLGQPNIPIHKSWKLNERQFGSLTGEKLEDVIAKYGKNQLQKWRYGYDVPPPPLTRRHKYYKRIVYDKRYENNPPFRVFPLNESVKAASERVLPYWKENILPEIMEGKTVLLVAHQNSLRSIIQYLENLEDEEIMDIYLENGVPFYYAFKKGRRIRVVDKGSLRFLSNPMALRRARYKTKEYIYTCIQNT